MAKNQYLVVEGMGGAGKGTVLADLAKRFVQKGFRVVRTFEPGGTPAADELRQELFWRKERGEITPGEELEYVFSARRLNMEEVVLPALASRELTVILKDRDYLSSFIYQIASGASRDLLLKFYREEYELCGFPRPDLRLLLLLSPQEAYKRRRVAGFDGDGFDMQPSKYWQDVAIGYHNEAMDILWGRGLFRRETRVVEAGQPAEIVGEAAWRVAAESLGLQTDGEGGELRLKDYPTRREGRRARTWYR